jgi:hypothetical protein
MSHTICLRCGQQRSAEFPPDFLDMARGFHSERLVIRSTAGSAAAVGHVASQGYLENACMNAII